MISAENRNAPPSPDRDAGLYGRFSAHELATLAQVKRFFELAEGDPDFCSRVDSGVFPPDVRARMRRIGIDFDPEELALLWKAPESARQCLIAACQNKTGELPGAVAAEAGSYTLFAVWLRFLAMKSETFVARRQRILPIRTDPRLEAWRMRRVHAARSELGFYGYMINHPVLSFELSRGCSVGCWFCAFAVHKLTGNLDYSAHRDFFRAIARSCVDIFGAEQAGRTMLYGGTEPHDNAHYLDFLGDYAEITGFAPFTSTAVGTDAPWLRSLISFYRQKESPASLRVSVLSRAALNRIHDLYSPEELLDVDLLMQMKEHPRPKVTSGKILQDDAGLRARTDGRYLDGGVVPQGTIECMSGFMVNLVDRTIKVISPCYACVLWPYGYRVFDEAPFSDADDFRGVVETLIDRAMPESPRSGMRMRFRDDLAYHATPDGFDLVSPNQVHHLRGRGPYRLLGEAIFKQTMTYKELIEELLNHQPDFTLAVSMVNSLFDHGLLDEVHAEAAQRKEK